MNLRIYYDVFRNATVEYEHLPLHHNTPTAVWSREDSREFYMTVDISPCTLFCSDPKLLIYFVKYHHIFLIWDISFSGMTMTEEQISHIISMSDFGTHVVQFGNFIQRQVRQMTLLCSPAVCQVGVLLIRGYSVSHLKNKSSCSYKLTSQKSMLVSWN